MTTTPRAKRTFFVIIDMATGYTLPAGGTKVEFDPDKPPRLFRRKAGATNAITCWKLGHWHLSVDSYGEMEGMMPVESNKNERRASRRKARDLQVGTVTLKIKVEP